ncbi:hypothetical protein KR009_007125 [Drosophila setifemur]|nr:hypothetical protein KR009_007125 [Drosophila setifemur]
MSQKLSLHRFLTSQLGEKLKSEAQTRATKVHGRTVFRPSSAPPLPYNHLLMPDLRNTYANMMDRVHRSMKTVRAPRKPKVAAQVSETPAKPSEEAPLPSTLVTKRLKRSKTGRIKGGANSLKANSSHLMCSRSNCKSLASLKATLNQKSQRGLGMGLGVSGKKTLSENKRIREVMQQKNVLETMLIQHRKLQRDRRTYALDIQRMLADLDRIRNKLDTSLQCLNCTKTIISAKSKISNANKSAIQKKSSHSTTNTSHRRSSGMRKVKAKTKANAIPIHANKTSALKPR